MRRRNVETELQREREFHRQWHVFANCIEELLTKRNQSVVSPNDLKYAVGKRAPMFVATDSKTL